MHSCSGRSELLLSFNKRIEFIVLTFQAIFGTDCPQKHSVQTAYLLSG